MKNRLALLLVLPLLFGGTLGAASARAAEPAGSLVQATGALQELDVLRATLVIDGLVYVVETDAQVEIGGSHGALSMLAPGMKLSFEFMRVTPVERRIVRIRQIPPQVELDGV